MILTDQKVLSLLAKSNSSSHSDTKPEAIQGMIFDKMCLGSITVTPSLVHNIQFLSLQSNFLSDISFLKHLPNLFYFDISKNSIEDLQPLNDKATFGYLHLTLGQFSDKKLLTLKGMAIAIFEVEMQDYSLFTQFLMSNPNVIALNNEVIYFSEKFLPQEDAKSSKKTTRSLTMKKSMRFCDLSFEPNSADILLKGGSAGFNSKESTHKELNSLVRFYNEFNCLLHSIISPMDFPSAHALSCIPPYRNIERQKLKLLASSYCYINRLTNQKELFLVYKGHRSGLRLFDFTVLSVKDIQNQLIILTVLVLFMLQMITKELAITTLNYILKHFHDVIESQLLSEESFSYCHLLGIYYVLFDSFIEFYTKRKEIQLKDGNNTLSHHNAKFDEIIHHLKMDELILKANYLSKISKEAGQRRGHLKKKSNLGIETESKRVSVKWKFSVLTELKLSEPILFLMQFLCDYLYSNKIDQILSDTHFDDYVALSETRDYLYKLSSEKLGFTLSDKKFQQNKASHMNNRLFLYKEYLSNRDRLNLNEDTILNCKKSKFCINKSTNQTTRSSHIETKSIFDHLHQPKRKKKEFRLTLEIEDYAEGSDDNRKEEEFNPDLYLSIRKIPQASRNDRQFLGPPITNKTISSFLLPEVKAKKEVSSIITVITPTNKVNSQMELWKSYKNSVKQLKQFNQKTFEETATGTKVHKNSKSLNSQLAPMHQPIPSRSPHIKANNISYSKDIGKSNKSRTEAQCTQAALTPSHIKNHPTTLSCFLSTYRPGLTPKAAKKNKPKGRKKESNPFKPFMSNRELTSLFTIRKYNENRLLSRQKHQ